jgi:hypothetical protein
MQLGLEQYPLSAKATPARVALVLATIWSFPADYAMRLL